MSTVPTHGVDRSSTPKFPLDLGFGFSGISLCWNVQLGVPEWWTHRAGMVDTMGVGKVTA
ncbi:hypothetical protein [Kibdelosporangium philippinense]|uniref:hypothetical protein n=1 Tax=Kibdelosporangium philippinense TaxID=211113 RepID=UPI0036199521